MSEVWVHGTYHVRPGMEDRVRASLRAHEERTRAEPGCLHAAVSQDLEESRTLYTIQRWADLEALEVHRALPHVATLSGGASETLQDAFVLVELRPSGAA